MMNELKPTGTISFKRSEDENGTPIFTGDLIKIDGDMNCINAETGEKLNTIDTDELIIEFPAK